MLADPTPSPPNPPPGTVLVLLDEPGTHQAKALFERAPLPLPVAFVANPEEILSKILLQPVSAIVLNRKNDLELVQKLKEDDALRAIPVFFLLLAREDARTLTLSSRNAKALELARHAAGARCDEILWLHHESRTLHQRLQRLSAPLPQPLDTWQPLQILPSRPHEALQQLLQNAGVTLSSTPQDADLFLAVEAEDIAPPECSDIPHLVFSRTHQGRPLTLPYKTAEGNHLVPLFEASTPLQVLFWLHEILQGASFARLHRRYAHTSFCAYRPLAQDETPWSNAQTLDFNRSNVRIRTLEPPPLGEKLEVRFRLHPHGFLLEFTGRVFWSAARSDQKGSPSPGFAMDLTGGSRSNFEALADFCDFLRESKTLRSNP